MDDKFDDMFDISDEVVKPKRVLSTKTKKDTLAKLKKALNEAWKASNKLIGEEPHTHTKNGNHLYDIRSHISLAQGRLDYIEYTENKNTNE